MYIINELNRRLCFGVNVSIIGLVITVVCTLLHSIIHQITYMQNKLYILIITKEI